MRSHDDPPAPAPALTLARHVSADLTSRRLRRLGDGRRIGSNEGAVELVGVPVRRQKVWICVLQGCAANGAAAIVGRLAPGVEEFARSVSR